MVLNERKLSFKPLYALIATVCMMLSMIFGGTSVYATNISEATAEKNLEQAVYNAVQNKSYTLEKGGSVSGKDIFKGSATKGYDIDEAKFQSLSTSAQKQLISDMVSASNGAVGSSKGVTESTVQNWWKQLQTKEGVGSRFLTEVLKNTKPDFVSANNIWQPFAGPLGVFLGLLAVITLSLLGINTMADIMYITLPMSRIILGDMKEKGGVMSKIISHAAITAVREVEEGSSEKGSKQAIGIYFKNKVFELILLGIALLYLVSGNIWTLVGYILDLVSGFLGF